MPASRSRGIATTSSQTARTKSGCTRSGREAGSPSPTTRGSDTSPTSSQRLSGTRCGSSWWLALPRIPTSRSRSSAPSTGSKRFSRGSTLPLLRRSIAQHPRIWQRTPMPRAASNAGGRAPTSRSHCPLGDDSVLDLFVNVCVAIERRQAPWFRLAPVVCGHLRSPFHILLSLSPPLF